MGAGQARHWRAWRCGDATLAGSVAIASWHVVAWARARRRWRAERDVGRRGGRRHWNSRRNRRDGSGRRLAARSRGSLGAIRQLEWRLFAQTGEHYRNALFERSDKLLVHFEHLLQISGRGIFHVIARAGRAGHGELRCQSSSNVMGGNFIPMARNGKQAYRCRTSRLWTRDGLSRSTHVGEGGRASVHHDTARSYRDHCFKGEHPFAYANRICTKRHSNPLFYVAKHRLIVCSGKRLTR